VLARADQNLSSSLDKLFELLRIQSISTDPAYKAECRKAAEWLVAYLEGFLRNCDLGAQHDGSRCKCGDANAFRRTKCHGERFLSAVNLMGEPCRSNFLILAGEHICFLQHYLNCALRVPNKGVVSRLTSYHLSMFPPYLRAPVKPLT
ncbi:hypothetical protein ACCS96_14945, partial [Rhizobium ruizarguesonis]